MVDNNDPDWAKSKFSTKNKVKIYTPGFDYDTDIPHSVDCHHH